MATINSLTAILSYAIALCGITPLFPWLPVAPRIALALGILVGIRHDLRGVTWALKNWQLNLAVTPLFCYYAVQFNRTNPVQPVVSVLTIMLGVRLCGDKNARHYLQIAALSRFSLATSTLFDLTPLFLFYLALMLLLVALFLVLLTFYSQNSRLALPRASLRRVLAAASLLPLASLPLMVILFPLLPRTQFPLWNYLAPPLSAPPDSATR